MDLDSFVLAAATADLTQEPRARADADAIEFRLDLADDPIEQLDAYDGDLPVIATNRIRAEGGQAVDAPARLDDLAAAVAYPSVEAVDVELSSIESGQGSRLVATASDASVALIVSTHDFEGTPDRSAMIERLREAAAAGDVGKLAVTATDPGDALALLEVTWLLSDDGVPVATMAMGEPGRHTRAIAPVYGSRIGYAPVDPARTTAPGQYDLRTLRALVDGLRSH